MDDKKWCICKRCIDDLKSRGEPIYVGPRVFDPGDMEFGEPERKCEWCDEVDELFECL